MKRQTKTIVSCLLVLAMLIGMSANCFAANFLAVTKVEILDSNNTVKHTYTASDLAADPAIEVQQNAQVVRVTGELTDDTATAVPYGTATYLAYLTSAEVEGVLNLDNSNIQYIDQMTTAANGTVTFTYRNRSSIAPGEGAAVTAKMGGTGVESAAGFAYTVIEDIGIFTLAGENEPIVEKTETAVTFNITASVREMPAPLTVKLGDVDVSDAVTVSKGVITIAGSKIATLAPGTYDISVAADKFATAYLPAAVVINSAITEIEPDIAEEIVGNIESTEVQKNAETGAVTIPVPGGAINGVDITVEGENVTKVVVDKNNNIVSLAPNVPFAKVDLNIAVKGSDKSAKKTVYMIPEGTQVSYGNLGLYTKEGENNSFVDALAYDANADATEQNNAFASFVTANNASILEDIAMAISVVMDSTKKEQLSHFSSALDFNGDGNLSLAEYRIYRLLMKGDEGDGIHTFTAVNEARNNIK